MSRIARRVVHSVLVTLLLAAVLLIASAHGARVQSPIVAVDLGSDWLRVGLARPAPSDSASAASLPQLEVVLSGRSGRRSAAMVGLDADGLMVAGDEAADLVGRRGGFTMPQVKRLLGAPFNSSEAARYARDWSELRLEPDIARETIMVELPASARGEGEEEEVKRVSVEEGVVLLLDLARQQAAAHLREIESAVKSVAAAASILPNPDAPPPELILTVPEHWSPARRSLLSQLASVAGFAPPTLIGELTAVAVDWAVRHLESEAGSEVPLAFFRVGATGSSACMTSIKRLASGHIAVRQSNCAHEEDVGGDAIDRIMADELAARFEADMEGRLTTPLRSNARGMLTLRREVRRLKEQLSASPRLRLHVESLHEGHDWRTPVSRREVEEWSRKLIPRTIAPLLRVLRGPNQGAVEGVELFGGASRMPAIQAAIRTALPHRQLYRRIDSDESALMGAAHVAAARAGFGKLTRVSINDSGVRSLTEHEDEAERLMLNDEQLAALQRRVDDVRHRAEQRRLLDQSSDAFENAFLAASSLLEWEAVAENPQQQLPQEQLHALQLLVNENSALFDAADGNTPREELDRRRQSLLAALEPLRALKQQQAAAAAAAAEEKERQESGDDSESRSDRARRRRAAATAAVEQQRENQAERAKARRVKSEREKANARRAREEATRKKAAAKQKADKKKRQAAAKKQQPKNGTTKNKKREAAQRQKREQEVEKKRKRPNQPSHQPTAPQKTKSKQSSTSATKQKQAAEKKTRTADKKASTDRKNKAENSKQSGKKQQAGNKSAANNTPPADRKSKQSRRKLKDEL